MASDQEDDAFIVRIMAMSDEQVLAGISPEKLAALMAERDAACARARQGIVYRDCATCSDQPTIPPDCPTCSGRGGFGPYPGVLSPLAPPTQQAPDQGGVERPRGRIIEAAETPGRIAPGDLALTIVWPNGVETLEHVSFEAAQALGYDYPDDPATPKANTGEA